MAPLAGVLITALMAWVIFAFNHLVRLRNQVRTAWADIDVQLQRRHDLIPQLVTVVKAYAAHEKATLEAVTALRAKAQRSTGAASQGIAETALEQALARLVALKESYPELKANENFAQLSAALVTVEDHLQFARRFYNGAVRDNNDAIQRVPGLLIARSFGFSESEFFQAEASSREAPKVELAP
ncbi:MAG TPA: LemA family protein [Chiayiivirga sp.]|nr:LemA family protein [Chiayiivirga sp.]